MKSIINNLEKVSKWYAIGLVILYSLLIAEFFSTINDLVPINSAIDNKIITVILRISYIVTILSGIIVWIVSAFIFHLTALLFNGRSQFKRFLFVSSYPYIIMSIVIIAGIFLLDGVQISETEDAINVIANNTSFKLAINLLNLSTIPYYLMIVILIHYIYQIKYLYALLSVVIPIASIWGITELFKLI